MGVVVLGSGGRLGRLLRPVYPAPATWLTRAEVDVADTDALQAAVRGAQAVLCLAGVTRGTPDALDRNRAIALSVLNAARAAGAGRVLLFSSAAVYGRLPGRLSEDGPTAPETPYADAKLAMERAAMTHPHLSTILRLGNVAGADAILGGWGPGCALDTLRDGKTPRRSYIGPITLARVLARLCAAQDLPDVLNLAAPEPVDMGALLDAAGLPWTSRTATADTIARVTLDTTRLAGHATVSLDAGTAQALVSEWREATR